MIVAPFFTLLFLSTFFVSLLAASGDSSESSDKRKAEQERLDQQYWQQTKNLERLHKHSQSAPENSGSKHAIDEAFREQLKQATANEEKQLQLQRDQWAARAEARKKGGE